LIWYFYNINIISNKKTHFNKEMGFFMLKFGSITSAACKPPLEKNRRMAEANSIEPIAPTNALDD